MKKEYIPKSMSPLLSMMTLINLYLHGSQDRGFLILHTLKRLNMS